MPRSISASATGKTISPRRFTSSTARSIFSSLAIVAIASSMLGTGPSTSAPAEDKAIDRSSASRYSSSTTSTRQPRKTGSSIVFLQAAIVDGHDHFDRAVNAFGFEHIAGPRIELIRQRPFDKLAAIAAAARG